ncbi:MULTISPECIES: hypothetical protein [Mameliella]|nr:hypothetical protein [Mameliella sp. LZ-28]MCR9275340.1 hypothetical protein [Paracoccaceae bacterium]
MGAGRRTAKPQAGRVNPTLQGRFAFRVVFGQVAAQRYAKT